MPPVTPALGARGGRQLSIAMRHTDGKQQQTMCVGVGTRQIQEIDTFQRNIQRPNNVLSLVIPCLLCICHHLQGAQGLLLLPRACSPVPRSSPTRQPCQTGIRCRVKYQLQIKESQPLRAQSIMTMRQSKRQTKAHLLREVQRRSLTPPPA